jgi:glycerol dehydrogenase-like iron-containing ADH family enzyme
MLIKTPRQYVNQPGILQSAGSYIGKLGKTALLIGGKTALAASGKDFLESIKKAGISLSIEEYQGYCTQKSIDHYAEKVNELQADMIIGVGGGKVLDLVKAVGEKANIPVVTVPTIAATCAAWSALSVLYDENGRFTGGLSLGKSPRLVLVDTRVIASAPLRYLRAGIADTLAKWYELAPFMTQAEDDVVLKIALQNAKLAWQVIREKAARAIEDASENHVTESFREVVDSIIVLAGLVGSIIGNTNRPALGHAIHNRLTFIPETHEYLHGEKVIFGVFTQLILEGKTLQEISEFLRFLNELELPVTLGQLGIADPVKTAAEVGQGMLIEAESLSKYPFPVTPLLVEKAMTEANRSGEGAITQSLNKGGISYEPNILAI